MENEVTALTAGGTKLGKVLIFTAVAGAAIGAIVWVSSKVKKALLKRAAQQAEKEAENKE